MNQEAKVKEMIENISKLKQDVKDLKEVTNDIRDGQKEISNLLELVKKHEN